MHFLPPLHLRSLSSLVACVGFTSVCCFAQPMFLPVESTPYDNQMTLVQPVLSYISYGVEDMVSMMIVNRWITKLRRIPYRYSRQWETPFEVNVARAADC